LISGFSSIADFPKSAIAAASRSVSLVIPPSAVIASSNTAFESRSCPLAFTTGTPSFLKASAASPVPSCALSIDRVSLAMDPRIVSTSVPTCCPM